MKESVRNERSRGAYALLSTGVVYSSMQKMLTKQNLLLTVLKNMESKNMLGKRVLDVGCGTGQLIELLDLFPQSFDYLGIDPSANYIETAKGRHPGRDFSLGTLDTLSLKDNCFDVAIFSGVLHHLSDIDAKNNLLKVASLLKPSGIVVAVDPVTFPGQHPIANLMARADRGRFVRPVKELERLFNAVSSVLQFSSTVMSGFLRLPYNHVVSIGGKPCGSSNAVAEILQSLPGRLDSA